MVRTTLLLLFSFAFAACASTEPTALHGEFDPALEDAERAKMAADEDRRDFQRVLLRLDQAMESFVRAVANAGVATQDDERERLDRLLRQEVSGRPPGSNTEKLIAVASDGSDPFFQGIALAALGFADRRDVMPVILQGAQLDDPHLVDRAILGLAILGDPRTPPGVIARVMNDPEHREGGRVGAAWALVRLQESSLRQDEIVPIWRRVLEGDLDQHPLILANALRGLGIARDPQNGALAARYLDHPTPRVRMNAAIAIGRMNAQDQHEGLFALLQPAESVPNVRLAARKALQALAGGVDRGYDVALWRREFDRGR
ncbi:MAG: HEAT repeat domain-containing protein [Planctomycetota bacterium]